MNPCDHGSKEKTGSYKLRPINNINDNIKFNVIIVNINIKFNNIKFNNIKFNNININFNINNSVIDTKCYQQQLKL